MSSLTFSFFTFTQGSLEKLSVSAIWMSAFSSSLVKSFRTCQRERENEWERELEMKENWMKAGFVDGEPPRKVPNQRQHSLALMHVSIHSNLLPIWHSPCIPISLEHPWNSFLQRSHWALDKTWLQPALLPTDFIHPCPWMLLKNGPVPCK